MERFRRYTFERWGKHENSGHGICDYGHFTPETPGSGCQKLIPGGL